MALSYEQQDQKVSSEPFVRRVAQAGVEVAVAVMAEAAEVPGHAERAAFGRSFLSGPLGYAPNLARGVVTNPNSGTGDSDPLVSDDALEFVVASLWNAYAGYTATGGVMALGATMSVAAEPDAVTGITPAKTQRMRGFWRWLFYRD